MCQYLGKEHFKDRANVYYVWQLELGQKAIEVRVWLEISSIVIVKPLSYFAFPQVSGGLEPFDNHTFLILRLLYMSVHSKNRAKVHHKVPKWNICFPHILFPVLIVQKQLYLLLLRVTTTPLPRWSLVVYPDKNVSCLGTGIPGTKIFRVMGPGSTRSFNGCLEGLISGVTHASTL